MHPSLIIHGGLTTPGDLKLPAKYIKIREILLRSYEYLLKTNALEAVLYAIRQMEDDEDFNAGLGAELQADGKPRLTASLIDCLSNEFAGVINIEHIQNPILVTRHLLSEKNKVLSGEGALNYALSKGLRKQEVRTAQSIQRWKEKAQMKTDTVGACALDAKGCLISGISTGGIGGETPGRVSDSGMPAGNFGNQHCAVVTTGTGQQIINDCVAAKIVVRCSDGLSLKNAFDKTFGELRPKKVEIGAVGVDKDGNFQWDETGGILVFGYKRNDDICIFDPRKGKR
jgi:L-asparaginase